MGALVVIGRSSLDHEPRISAKSPGSDCARCLGLSSVDVEGSLGNCHCCKAPTQPRGFMDQMLIKLLQKSRGGVGVGAMVGLSVG